MRSPVILFGAFDRHNFGDLLFPHVVAALLPDRELKFAGLADRDLRAHGGHRVGALPRVVEDLDGRPATLIHAGGELLTCDAWQAAVMLSTPDHARDIVARLDARPSERREWARRMLGTDSLAPYTVSRKQFAGIASVLYHAVGGVELRHGAAALREEVLGRLAAADDLSVRDTQTQAQLEAAGIAARLVPDPAVMTAELFGARIRRRADDGEVAQTLRAFPRGYVAVQFSADFGDDATLAGIAAQFDRVAASTGCGVVFFRAGAAPWHDDLDCYRRTAARMRTTAVSVFGSLDLWDICALIAGSRGYCGSSLHGRILAMAFALPRVNLRHPGGAERPTKQSAFAATWDHPGMPAMVGVDAVAESLGRALAVDAALLRSTAGRLVSHYRRGLLPLLEACDRANR